MKRLSVLVLTIAMYGTCEPAQARQSAVEYRPELLVQLGVSNLDRAIRFYTTVLGFELTERRDDLKFAHIATNVPGLQIGLNEIADPRGTGSAVLNRSINLP